MSKTTSDKFQVEFSFLGSVENIRKFSIVVKNSVQSIWPDNPNLAFEVELCLTEALSNAHFHAHNEKCNKSLSYKIKGVGDKIRIHVFDSGNGFSLEQEIQKNEFDLLLDHGRGLKIIRNLVDRLDYSRGKQRNKLTIDKKVRSEVNKNGE